MSTLTSTRTTIAALAVGVLATGALVGATLVLSEGHGDVELPETLGDKVAIDTVAAYPADLDAEQRDEAITNFKTAVDYNNARMEELYDTDVVTGRYVPSEHADGSQFIVTVIDKEVDLVPPVAFNDPELADLAAPADEVVHEGEAECLVTRNQVPKAQGSDENLAPLTIVCQRVGDGRTVRVFASREPDLDETVEATNELWDDIV